MSLEQWILYVILPIMAISMVLITIRVLRGPSLMDRVVALDLLVIVSIGALSAYAILHNIDVLIDIALVLALIAFLSSVGFAVYHMRSKKVKDRFDLH
ncbi:MAG TPA: monovalent cation/H+ antiporter complex subunit F [Bacteroidales bacterium]|nr:monovalent cation/H+ antiporter complex subunit F [Bacteroidales bacterium]